MFDCSPEVIAAIIATLCKVLYFAYVSIAHKPLSLDHRKGTAFSVQKTEISIFLSLQLCKVQPEEGVSHYLIQSIFCI